jgi:hypothetical protein
MFVNRDPSLSEYYDFDATFYSCILGVKNNSVNFEVLACTLNTSPISFYIYSLKRNFARLG